MSKKLQIIGILLCMIFITIPATARAATVNKLADPGGETVTGGDTRLNRNGWIEENSPEQIGRAHV